MFRSLAFLIAATTTFTSIASAQVASAILRVGDAPAGGGGTTVTTISGTAANQVGGVAVRITLSNTNHAVWGDATSTAGVVLRQEQLGIAGYDQTAFEGFFGISDTGTLSYGPTCTDTTTLVTGLDCVWLDNSPIAVEGLGITTLPGFVYVFASRPGITGSGVPYWVSGIDDLLGNDAGDVIFLGTGETVVLKTGDPAPAPLASTLSNSTGDFDVRFSRNGTNYILTIDTVEVTTADAHLVMSGAIVLDAGGTRMSEGQVVSVAAGGNGIELYSNFGALGVNDAGDFMATGDTDAVATADAFVMKNGVILAREGGVVGGLTLTGNNLSAGASMNDAGHVAYAWDTTGSITGIFFNSTLLLKEGDAVDFDGNGIVEATSIFKATTGIDSLVLGNTHLFFSATVTVASVDTACVLAIALPNTPSSAYCSGDGSDTLCPCANPGLSGRGCDNTAASGGANVASTGIASISADTLVLHGRFAVPFGPGLYYQGSTTANPSLPFGVAFGNGLRCAGGSTPRLEIRVADGTGASDTTVAINVLGSCLAGDVRNYQLWYRDTPNFGACTSGFNLSNAITLAWTP